VFVRNKYIRVGDKILPKSFKKMVQLGGRREIFDHGY